MLARLLAALGSNLAGALLDKLIEPFRAYIAGQTTRATLQAEIERATVEAAAETDKANAAAVAQAFGALMQAAAASPAVARAWAAVVYSQLAVLIWHQVGIPWLVLLTGRSFPSSGATVEWAYLLIAGCMGFGLLLRAGGKR